MTLDEKRDLASSPFPRGVQFTPVPNPLLSGLLEQIDDLAELKLTLRVVWALNRKASGLAYVTESELCSDRSVGAMLGSSGDLLEAEVRRALLAAVGRGTLLGVPGTDDGETRYLLNTQPVRAALAGKGYTLPEQQDWTLGTFTETQQSEARPELHQGVFRVYEENIGVISPLIAESITAALQEYPESDVVDAMRVAVEANARSWKYVLTVLKRWAVEGRDERDLRGSDGKPERYSEANRSDEYIERYLERKRSRGG